MVANSYRDLIIPASQETSDLLPAQRVLAIKIKLKEEYSAYQAISFQSGETLREAFQSVAFVCLEGRGFLWRFSGIVREWSDLKSR